MQGGQLPDDLLGRLLRLGDRIGEWLRLQRQVLGEQLALRGGGPGRFARGIQFLQAALHAVERREGGGEVVGVGGVWLQRAQQLARPVLAGLLVDVDGEGGLPRGVLRVLHGAAQGEVFLNLPVERGAALGGGLPRALRLSAAGEQPDGGGDSSGTDAEADPDEGAEGL